MRLTAAPNAEKAANASLHATEDIHRTTAHASSDHIAHCTRFTVTPARLTRMSSRRGRRKRSGFTGTGFAHPNPIPNNAENKNIRVPAGSRWARGESVSRPASFAVSSPHRKAT